MHGFRNERRWIGWRRARSDCVDPGKAVLCMKRPELTTPCRGRMLADDSRAAFHIGKGHRKTRGVCSVLSQTCRNRHNCTDYRYVTSTDRKPRAASVLTPQLNLVSFYTKMMEGAIHAAKDRAQLHPPLVNWWRVVTSKE